MARVAEVAPAAAMEAPVLAMTVETENSTRIPDGGEHRGRTGMFGLGRRLPLLSENLRTAEPRLGCQD